MIRIFLLLLTKQTLYTVGKVQKPSPEILPFNQLFSTRLESGEGKLFYLLDGQQEEHPLSVSIIPCSAPVHWSALHRQDPGIVPSEDILRMVEEGGPKIIRGSDMRTFKLAAAEPGLYIIPVLAPSAATAVQIFVSLDPGGPHDLNHLQNPDLKLTPLRRRKLSVRWQPSVVNPQHMNYCLVVSTVRVFSRLCEVQELLRLNSSSIDHQVTCVQKRNSVMLQHLKKGATYFVSLFATNAATQLTVPYGNGSVVMSSKVKPIPLVDGTAKSVNLRKQQGRINFRFKVSETGKDMHLYVVTCGGSVMVEILQRRHVVQSRRVAGYGRFTVLKPRRGDVYSIRVTAADAHHLANIRSVEALATQNRSKFPLPEMPSVTDVHEYVSKRGCSSVTIGWVPSPATRALYCVIVRRLPTSHYSPVPLIADQCGLDVRHKRASHIDKKCETITAGNSESVTTHNVTNLKPGTGYSIQITVKKGKGRTLSYKMLNVFTKHSCN